MLPRVEDTIVALSSAPGPGARAIVRLSGAQAIAIAERACQATFSRQERGCQAAEITLPGVHSPLPAQVHVWPAPRTYTGQDVVELHTLGCPPLVDLLIGRCLALGARAAQAGEFTMRAFL